MDSLKSATLTKADGSTVDAATALQQKVLIFENFKMHASCSKLSWVLLCLQYCPHNTLFLPGFGIVLLLSALVPPL